jgi:hypothetical protein
VRKVDCAKSGVRNVLANLDNALANDIYSIRMLDRIPVDQKTRSRFHTTQLEIYSSAFDVVASKVKSSSVW